MPCFTQFLIQINLPPTEHLGPARLRCVDYAERHGYIRGVVKVWLTHNLCFYNLTL